MESKGEGGEKRGESRLRGAVLGGKGRKEGRDSRRVINEVL